MDQVVCWVKDGRVSKNIFVEMMGDSDLKDYKALIFDRYLYI